MKWTPGWLEERTEWVIAFLGAVTVGSVLFAAHIASSSIERNRMIGPLAQKFESLIANSHLRLEETLAEGETDSLRQEVFSYIDTALEICRATRDGGMTVIGPIKPFTDPQALKNQAEMHKLLVSYRQWTAKRWDDPSNDAYHRGFEQVYKQITLLCNRQQAFVHAGIIASENRLATLQYSTALMLAVLFAGLAISSRLRRMAEKTKRQDLEKEVQERTAKLTREIAIREKLDQELAQARDAALESTRLKSEFLANMSHEIRTPMNGIIGMAELLLGAGLTPQQHDFTDTIRTSAITLLAIVNDILDFSKIEAGKLTLETIDFDLRETVELAVESLAESAQSKGLDMIVHIHSGIPVALRGDPGRLRQILINLLNNAIKFTLHGEVILEVSLEQETATQARLRFSVTDTGIGIAQEEKERIFQAFSQADGSTSRRFGGTGLGLVISKQLVTHMGGLIDMKSMPEKGSTFWFIVPFDKQNLNNVKSQPDGNPLKGLRLLIVDDNQKCREALAEEAAAWGLQCGQAADQKEALSLLHQGAETGKPYAIAILDLHPEGEMLAEKIKADSLIAHTGLVMMTPLNLLAHYATVHPEGISACLSKPILHHKLFRSLCAALPSTEKEEARKPAFPAASAPAVVSEKIGHRILVAEDNAVNQKVALYQLRQLGCEADAVSSGNDVLELLKDVQYDVILMDCQMPGMDGFQTTREIRKMENPARAVKIIAMTAHVMAGAREECLEAGMDDYVSKPVRIDELRTALQRCISNGDNTAPVDPAAMAQSHENEDILNELCAVFIESGKEQIAKAREALKQASPTGIERAAHALKGGCSYFGAHRLETLSGQLETLGHSRVLQGTEDLLTELENEFSRVCEAIKERSHVKQA